MDGDSFDAWIKTLTAGHARRAVVRVVAAGALAAGLARLGLREAAASCRGTDDPCARDDQCCSNRCVHGNCRCSKTEAGCNRKADCCQGESGLEKCAHVSGCGPRTVCCRKMRKPCSRYCDCCGILHCLDNGCDPGARCCHFAGSPCTDNCQCCTTLTCVAGLCQA
jgi:hypothetical protein